jgi:hypothetical protein
LSKISAKENIDDFSSEKSFVCFKIVLKWSRISKEKESKIEYQLNYPNKILSGKCLIFKSTIKIKRKNFMKLTMILK